MSPETSEDWEQLLEIKDQEIAQLSKIKNILQQKLVEASQKIKDLQIQFHITTDLPTDGEETDAIALQEKNRSVTSPVTDLEGEMEPEAEKTREGRKLVRSEFSLSLEEKIDQILHSVNELLSKIKFASKLPPPKTSPPESAGQTEETRHARAFKPSDILRRQQTEATPMVEEEEGAQNEEEEEVEEPSSKISKRQEPEFEEKGEKLERKGQGEQEPAHVPADSGILTLDYPADGSIVCPKCGKQKFQELQDPSVVVSFAPVKKFGRKFSCKSCRTVWRYKAM